MKTFTGTEGLEYYANIFFNLPVKEQNKWTETKFGVSSRTFRRWCDKHDINITKTVKLS
ncbi:hypothetical protein [Pantoea stewartii]|uniref:hypothetical protein n=1 Tax=Pantoea stewartii TaxID=66269 RepID=UPI00198267B4|nr:hypothetical protein [Pantoea stewartii]